MPLTTLAPFASNGGSFMILARAEALPKGRARILIVTAMQARHRLVLSTSASHLRYGVQRGDDSVGFSLAKEV